MSLTFIDTNKIPHVKVPGSGEMAEIMGGFYGAKNVVGNLRWLKPGNRWKCVRAPRSTNSSISWKARAWSASMPKSIR